MFFLPIGFIFIFIFFFYILFFFFLVQVNIIALAFVKIGIPSEYVFSALFLSLVGSLINIPVKRIPQQDISSDTTVHYFGSVYNIPKWQRKETVLAVNLGGAVIPVLISFYLLLKTGLWLEAGIATSLITVLTYRFARPIKGVGIALPAFLPPLFATFISILIAYHDAPVVAYISGAMGTLIGADLMHLKEIGELGAPVASIGGAGTFDGIFLNGIIAVLLATFIL